MDDKNIYTKYLPHFKSVALFQGIDLNHLPHLLMCKSAMIKKYKKGEFLLHQGDISTYVGILLEGQIHLLREDDEDNSALFSVVEVGGNFFDAICFGGSVPSPGDAVANKDSIVLQLPYPDTFNLCKNSCEFHISLIENVLKSLSMKYLKLLDHMTLIQMKSLRERILSYLRSFIPGQGGNITVPINREEMSRYLGVSRTSLSHELASMKKEGLIDYWKNCFVIHARKNEVDLSSKSSPPKLIE